MYITIIGATGNVGRCVLKMFLKSNILNIKNIRVTSSQRSAGMLLKIQEQQFIVEDTAKISFKENEICIFNTDAEVSSKYIPLALAAGAYVVDSSSYYRMTSPLIIPSVNINTIDIKQNKLFSHSNCIVSPIATALSPLHKNFIIDRVIISTYQSTSGAGKKAMDECLNATHEFCQTKVRKQCQNFPRPIQFNIVPQIGQFDNHNFSDEESKIINELQKILKDTLYITATAVRVPALVGHSSSVSVKLMKTCHLQDIITVFKQIPEIILSHQYHTPIEVEGSDSVYIGRIRYENINNEIWLHMWICSDNLRVGAATDAFKITKAILTQLSA